MSVHSIIDNIATEHGIASAMMEKLGNTDNATDMLKLSMDLMVQQQKVSIMNESFNKEEKLTTDGVKNAIQSMG